MNVQIQLLAFLTQKQMEACGYLKTSAMSLPGKETMITIVHQVRKAPKMVWTQ
jgi:hypothetical protein